MPVLSARQVQEGREAVQAAPAFSLERPKKQEVTVWYLQHPEHCESWPIAGEITVAGKVMQIVDGLTKTTVPEAAEQLIKAGWIQVYRKGANQ